MCRRLVPCLLLPCRRLVSCLLLPHLCPAARELVREVDYTLKTLAKNLLGQERSEVPSTGETAHAWGTAIGRFEQHAAASITVQRCGH